MEIKENAPQKVIFAKLGDKGFIAGVSLDQILMDAKHVYPEVPREAISIVDEKDIPNDYQWSMQKMKESNNWQLYGTYFLFDS